ncbi:hypothetical protein RIR_jg40242.t1 [Rhizophagus irregularis DAOM 181602=DAOM 197198]|nr:hypothetical protein RIR_jg40242.t1 [Rhizophagus irregularis DAOM 181602=DAOM 197198]
MSTHQARSAQHRQVTRSVLAELKQELTDSNFTADIAIGTPGEHDYASFLTAHRIIRDGNFSEDDGVEYIYRYNIPFKTRNMPILPSTDINGTFNFALARIMQKVEDYVNYGSGWEFYRVEKIFYRNLAIPTTHRSRTYTTPKRSCYEKGSSKSS